jgi:hypothetical protein
MERLSEVYYGTLMGATANPRVLRDAAWRQGVDVSLKQADLFLRDQETTQRFRRQNPRPFHVPIVGKPNQYAADLMFFDRGSQNIPILIIQELTSRKAYAVVQSNKTADTTLSAFKTILGQVKKDGFDIQSLEHDSGAEFHGNFKSFLTASGIEDIEFPRGNASKTAMGKINVFIRTLRTMMERAETNFGGDWRDLVHELIDVYNNTRSSSTGFAPNDVKTRDHFAFIRAMDMGRNPGSHAKVNALHEGQSVRVLIDTDIFKKGSRPKFSKEIYTITGREGYSFTLSNAAGEPVMASNIKGEPLNRVRPFRAWELLAINSGSVAEPPEKYRSDSQRLDDRERHKAVVVNRERRLLDVEPIVQETPNPGAYDEALAREELPDRVRVQTEKAREEAERKAEEEKRRAERPEREPVEAAPQITDYVVKVLSHRVKKGCLEFQILWNKFQSTPEAPENRTWQPIKNFRSDYDRKAKRYMTWDKVVAEYMTANKLPFNKKGC